MMPSARQIRVVIADDHEVFGESLGARIDDEPDMMVLATVTAADAAAAEATAKKADVLLLDIEMPGRDSFAVATELVRQQPSVRVIFLSAFTHDSFIDRAIRARAWGYVSKSESLGEVINAIRDVHRGWVHYSAKVRARIVHTPEGPRLRSPAEGAAITRASQLTARELELLRQLAQGLSVKEIAQVMHISAKTVDSHKCNLMAKLGIHDRVELARFAFREEIAAP